jgi:hypothetical protein
MAGEGSPLSIIPSECFRWRPRVQFIDTFQTRKSAIDYAFDHGYNLIVERNEGSTPLFDVLLDPERSCTEGLNLELLQSEDVLVEGDTKSWTSLMLVTLWGLCERLAAAIASQNCWADMHRAFRGAWKRYIFWEVRNLRKRFGVAATFCYARITAQHRHVAGQPRWADEPTAWRRAWGRWSSAVISFAKEFAAEAVILYKREVVPFIQRTARLCWWSNSAVAFRRWWHRHSQASTWDLPKLFTASFDNLYKRTVAPRLRQAVDRYRREGIGGPLHRAWSISVVTFSSLARRFTAAVAVFCNPDLAPFILQAAGSFRRAEIENAYRRSVEAVAAPHHSNSSSHLG